MIFFSRCLELFDHFPDDTTFAAAFSWLILALVTFSLSSISLSSVSLTTFSAVYTRALPGWQQSLAVTTLVSLAPERSVLSISTPNSLSTSPPWADLPSCATSAFSLKEKDDCQVTRWSALWANWLTALDCLGIVLRCGVGVAGRDWHRVIFCECWRKTLHGSRGQIPVASKALKMLFLVYAAALACVTSL